MPSIRSVEASRRSENASYEALFLENLATIERIVGFVAGRYRLGDDDREELGAEVKLNLVMDDYRHLRRFEGRSKLETYLFTVINSIFWEWRNKARGRWRPSAEALRLGETAILLENLVYRDGYRFAEAVTLLHTNYGVTLDESELEIMLARLPERPGRHFLGEEQLAAQPDSEASPEDQVVEKSRAPLGDRVRQTLQTALETLAVEDRLILRLHFQKELKLVEVARSLGYPQKRFYRRMETILKTVRGELNRLGLEASDGETLFAALRKNLETHPGTLEWGPPNGNEVQGGKYGP